MTKKDSNFHRKDKTPVQIWFNKAEYQKLESVLKKYPKLNKSEVIKELINKESEKCK